MTLIIFDLEAGHIVAATGIRRMSKVVELPTIAEGARILDAKQAANLLGLSVVHLRRLYRSGKIPKPITVGTRKYGWRTDVLTSFIADKSKAAA